MSPERHIVAMGGGGFTMDDPLLDRYVLDLVDAARPKVCFLPHATAALPVYVLRFLAAFPASRFEPTYLDLFDRTIEDVAGFLAEQDRSTWAGATPPTCSSIWRVHGVDAALRAAWESGVICCGVSAGANCWFEASTTDSFLLGQADPLRDGLGLLPGSFTPHYDAGGDQAAGAAGARRIGRVPRGAGVRRLRGAAFRRD